MKVTLKNLCKKYAETFAVKDLDLNIDDGALHFILGPSGCGKTTTLRMLAGLEKPSSGQLFFDNRDVTYLSPSERNIGMVFQNYALWPHMTVEQNISYGLKIKKIPKKELNERIEKYLNMMHLAEFRERYPSQLSGGQQQRVALARAIAIQPSVLLLDEPLSNLDAKLRLEMRHNLKKIHEETGITTIYVTHDQSESLSMGTKITVMDKGEQIQTEDPKTLYKKPKNAFIAKFIGETNLITGVYKEQKNGLHQIQTSFGMIQAKEEKKSFQKEQKVTLSIRPESIKSNPMPIALNKEALNIFPLTIRERTYLGESEQLRLISKQEDSLLAKVFNYHQEDFAKQNMMNCFIDPLEVNIFPS